MKVDEVRKRAFAMPLTSPAFPPGPYKFVDREFFIVTYRTDPAALEEVVPEPLKLASRSSSTSSSGWPIRLDSATTPSQDK
jgi:acetoacetate decarboxylase